MTAKFETLVEDIMNMVDEGVDRIDDVAIHNFVSDVEWALRRQLLKEERHDRNTVRMSNVGKPDRQLWYEVNGAPKEELRPATRIKFLYGDIIEALVLFLAKAAGHDVSDSQKEVELEGVKGHIDCVIDGVLVDVKSASKFSFKKFKDGTLPEDDAFGYIGQISSYKQAGQWDKAAFLAMNKESGELTVYEPDLIDMNKNADERIRHVKEMVEQDTPPERCFKPVADGKSGNLKLDTQCSYCAFKHHCWSHANDGAGIRTFIYSNGPRFLVKVEREPDVPEAT